MKLLLDESLPRRLGRLIVFQQSLPQFAIDLSEEPSVENREISEGAVVDYNCPVQAPSKVTPCDLRDPASRPPSAAHS